MTGSRIGAGVLGMCSMLALAGCESRVSLGSTCAFTSECPVGLSCTAGRCRAECLTERDCQDGRRCLQGPAGVGVCSAEPEDRCASVSDCGDPLFAACVGSRCQTGCTSEAECARGACVEGSCLEPTLAGLDEVGAVALGLPAGTAGAVVESSSFVLHATDDPSLPLLLATASGFTDLDVAVERGATAGEWRLHVATMESPETSRGLPVLLDVALRDVAADTVARVVAAGSDATSVAAEAIGDGRPAFLWVVGTPDPIDSPDSPLTFAFFQRAQEGTNVMRTDSSETRFPAEAAIATGVGADGLGPSWGIRVASPTESYFMAVAASGGAGSQAILDLSPEDRMPVDARGTHRAFVLRTADGSVHLARVTGDGVLTGALQDLGFRSSCAPGIAHRPAATDGNYVLATCSTDLIELRRLECPAMDALAACRIVPVLQVRAVSAPAEVALESWPGGVVLIDRRPGRVPAEGGVDVRLVSDALVAGDAAMVAEGLPTFLGTLPPLYQPDAFTDFRLRHVASTTATEDGASVLVVGGFYEDDNSVAQLRLAVLEIAAVP